MAHVLPPEIDALGCALVERLTVGLHAARRAGVPPGGPAAVLVRGRSASPRGSAWRQPASR